MAIVKKYKARLKSIHNKIAGIYTLEFESLSKPFSYAPGQFLHLALDNDYDESDQWPESRCFSMQSNPDEETIRITYAIKGNFTKEMEKSLQVGTEVWLKLPYGDLFSQTHNKENTVFIAGGTGVTPFLSLFTHSSFAEYDNSIIYLGFKTKDTNIYTEELKKAKQINNTLKVKYFYENKQGIIDIEKIITENGHQKSYFISGPPLMINHFRDRLFRSGVAENNILTDDWE